MSNRFDYGIQEDFDNMTKDLAVLVKIYHRNESLDYGGQDSADMFVPSGTYYQEFIFIQELSSKHEMVASGQLDVSDVQMTYVSNSVIEEEDIVEYNGKYYKVLELNKIEGENGQVMYITSFGKKFTRR